MIQLRGNLNQLILQSRGSTFGADSPRRNHGDKERPLMSLMTKRRTRIDAKQVAEIIGCSRKTVLNGGAGTSELTRIRNGAKFVRFILEEVEALAEKQERRARSQSVGRAYYQERRGQHTSVTL
jgi:predicted DNA-binding transcriptional regulator AlpA